MSSYIGKHAELYDIFYAEKDYDLEASFVHECLKKYSPYPVISILELAGGTGRHASHLSKQGYKILITDHSKDMLNVGRTNYNENKKMTFEHWDMSLSKKFNISFDAAICLFDAIGYVQTNEKVINTLRNVHVNLKEKGIFILEFWNAGAMLKNYEPVRVRHFKADVENIIRISETSLDYHNQTATVNYTIIINGDKTQNISESQTNRYFLLQEMDSYLGQAGFKVLNYFAGYSYDTKIDIDTWHTVVVAQKV